MLPLVFRMALPAVAAQLVNLLYTLVDRVYIGHIPGIGTDALAGVGVTSSVIILISAFSAIVAGGGAPLAAIALGQGHRERAGKILGNGFVLLVLFAVVTSTVSYLFMKPILTSIGASTHTLPYAVDYLSVYVLNIVLDPLFIFTFDMGVKGAALATILSQACSAVWVLAFLTSKRASLQLERRYLQLDRRIVGATLALGLSPFIMASTESLVGFVLNGSLERYGDIYVSALAVMQAAMLCVSVPLTGFAQGFVPVVSYNFGHGNRERVKECFKIVVTVMFLFNFLLVLLMILFPSLVSAVFTSDAHLTETVTRTMPVFLAGMTIFGLQRACQNMFVALGQAKVSIFIALLRKVILLVPLALLLPRWMGVMGIFAAEGISDAVAAICCTTIFAFFFPRILARMKVA